MNNKKIVFHVSGNHYSRDFECNHTYKIWQELAKGFDEYHIFARNKDFEFYNAQKNNIFIHLIPSINERMFLFFFSSWLLPFYILKYKPSVMLVQCPVMGGLAVTLSSGIFKIPFLVELHGQHYFKSARRSLLGGLEHLFYKKLAPITFAKATKIRMLSNHMRQEFQTIYGHGFDDKLSIIPVRVDFSKFSRKDDYHIANVIKLVNVGGLNKNKNQLGLLKALSKISQEIQITLIGEGEQRGEIENYISQIPKNIKVVLTGSIGHDSIAKVLKESDIYIHYSSAEGTPRAVIEAMAVGLPVIVKDAGFMNDILIDNKNAIVLRESNDFALLAAIEKIISSESLRIKLGEEAHNMVIEMFEWNRCFELYRKELLGLID